MFGFLIFIHELGHFVAAKATKMTVLEFSIGMGPAIIKWGKGQTKYSIRLLPIGGFVKLEGEDEENSDPNAFNNKPALSRFVVMFAGAFMNLLLALIISIGLVAASEVIITNVVSGFHEEISSSSQTGLNVGDKILEINGRNVYTSSDIVLMLSYSGGKPMDITVERDGKEIVLSDVEFEEFEEQGLKGYYPDFYLFPAKKTIPLVIKDGFFQCIAVTRSIWQSLFEIFKGNISVSQLSGPVGTTEVIGEAVSQGLNSLLYFVMFISVNLGVVNLLPFPALDGGRILFLIIEKIRRKPINRNVEGFINFVGFALLIALMCFVTFNDVLKLL